MRGEMREDMARVGAKQSDRMSARALSGHRRTRGPQRSLNLKVGYRVLRKPNQTSN